MRLQCVINHRKIICSSEPPRSLISFVPIDLTAISETGGGAGSVGSIQAIDQELNDLVYTVTVETDQEMQKKSHHSKVSAGFYRGDVETRRVIRGQKVRCFTVCEHRWTAAS